ncbi:hypothetical protein RHECNPAF_25300104 [Rhizobium etli CNPAF512]|nr:hypothetical protein RHECNPAF_25300104 [Rhizobium etli CNPAF512]
MPAEPGAEKKSFENRFLADVYFRPPAWR